MKQIAVLLLLALIFVLCLVSALYGMKLAEYRLKSAIELKSEQEKLDYCRELIRRSNCICEDW